MRWAGLVSVVVLAAPAGVAAESADIEWHPSRPLVWEDFRGAVPRGAAEERVAATAASISWSYRYEIERSRDTCAFSIVALESAARFRPDQSWVRPGHRRPAILEHEQVHFDIARLYSQRFLAATRELVGSRHACRGSSDRKAARSAEDEISRLAGTIYEEIWRAFRLRQETYDRETRHGIDVQEQARWSGEIAAALRGQVPR